MTLPPWYLNKPGNTAKTIEAWLSPGDRIFPKPIELSKFKEETES